MRAGSRRCCAASGAGWRGPTGRRAGGGGGRAVARGRGGGEPAADARSSGGGGASRADARPETRARRALAVLGALGAEAELERADDGFVIRGYGCPLSAAVCAEPNVCAAVEELVSA